MKNWKKIDARELNRICRELKFNAAQRRNLKWLLDEVKKKGYKGVYNINITCMCGRDDSMIMLINDFSNHLKLKEKFDRDEKPRMMCSSCNLGAMELTAAGVDKRVLPTMLGWKDSGDAVAG